MRLRPYQQQAVDNCFVHWQDKQSTLVVLPTGLGKTRLACEVIQRTGGRCLFMAHRGELIWQAAEHIKHVTGLSVGIEMAEHKTNEQSLFARNDVIVATVQTLTSGGDGGGRLGKFSPDDFSLVILDECHYSVAATWKRVTNHFKKNPNCKILGITATPDRLDEEALGQVFESVAFSKYEIKDAINDGWLVPIYQKFVPIEGLDFSHIRTQGGDLAGSDLAAVMESEKNLHGVADATIREIGNKKGIGFAASVKQAEILADIFNRHKAGMASWVSGKTDKDERKKIISDFAAGRIQFLWNCNCFTEGFDETSVEIIVNASPTKSRAKYAQRVGRGTRPIKTIANQLNHCPSSVMRRALISRSVKPCMTVLDFVGNSGRHKLITTGDILGGKYSDEVIKAAIARVSKGGGPPVRMDKEIEDEEKRQEELKKKKLEEQARKSGIVGKAKYSIRDIDPFDVNDVTAATPRGTREKKSFSPKQIQHLKSAGLDHEKLSYREGTQYLNEIFRRYNENLCNFKQMKVLARYGYDTNCSYDEASRIITSLAANGWKKPKIILPKRNESKSDNPY